MTTRLKEILSRAQIPHYKWMTTLAVAGYILFGVIGNYNLTWMVPEFPIRFLDKVFETGTGLTKQDLLNSFEFEVFSEGPRARFLSTFFLIVNAKLRVWLWNWFPPHQSFSLTWIFLLVLTPWALYQWLRHWTQDRYIAWSACLLFVCTAGFLSGISLFCHAGKPMAGVTFILGGLILSRLPPRDQIGLRSKRILLLTLFFVLMNLSFYFDETSIIAAATYPVLFLEHFWGKQNWKVSTLFICSFIFMALSVFFFVPALTQVLGFGKADIWANFLVDNHRMGIFNPLWGLQNIYMMARDHFFSVQSNPIRAILAFSIFIYFCSLAPKIPSPHRTLLLRLLLSIVIFTFGLSLMHTKHYHLLRDSYYYGIIFNCLLATFTAIWISTKKRPLPLMHQLVLIVLLYSSTRKFEYANMNSQNVYNRKIVREEFLAMKKPVFSGLEHMHKLNPVDFSKIYYLWTNRENPSALEKIKPQLPAYAYSTFYELEKVKRPAEKDIF